MAQELESIIKEVEKSQYSFCKFISANDAGITGAHQAGLYIPKNSIYLLFDEPGEKGENKEKFATIIWEDGQKSNCRFIYYGKGSRNEYRITRLGRHFKEGEFIIIVKKNETEYFGWVLKEEITIQSFLETFNIKPENTNSIIPVSENNLFVEEDDSSETSEISFKPKAHILVLLGEELIKNPVMAIYELIKNGYDADANEVDVIFENIEDEENSKILIEDSGTGITDSILKNVWFEPGTDFRKPIENGIRQIKRSPVHSRIPMGEKGIGRFAVHKLGNKIKLISRPAKVIVDEDGKFERTELFDYELEVNIDWRKFSQSKYLEDVNIEWKKRTNPNTFRFKNTHGTFIEISSLKEAWSRGMARQLKRNTISMLSPKNDFSKFKINLDFKNNWLQALPETEDILKKAPYKLVAFVDANYKMTFEYEFKLDNNPTIGVRSINEKCIDAIDKKKYEQNIRGQLKPYYRKYLQDKGYDKDTIEQSLNTFASDNSLLPFGNLMLELYSFDLDPASMRDYISSPALIKDLLRDHAGIKVFKGYLRVYDYGDPGNDWLGLDIKRVNNKTWFSNNQNIGYIYLDDASSGLLIEKTNREGFIKNDTFDFFVMILDFILSEFKTERIADREKWLAFNKKGSDNSFEAQLNEFKNLITSMDFSDSEKREKLLIEAEKIEQRYEHDKNTLLIPAGVGMTASFAIHEIEKLVPRMEESVKENPLDKVTLTGQVEELRDYTNGILSVLRKGGNKPVPPLELIKQAISNHSLKLKHRNINVEIYSDSTEKVIHCDRRLFITMMMNLIDNSIYWLETVHKADKGIYISLTTTNNAVSVLIVDNGPGFKDKIEDIVRPFFTRKEDGIGIGMYLIDTVMMQQGRLNIIYDTNYLKERGVPLKFNGAAVELIFKQPQ